ncbi:MAG: hypothetical protein ACJ8FY_09175 [Gemmataceae bacterium]
MAPSDKVPVSAISDSPPPMRGAELPVEDSPSVAIASSSPSTQDGNSSPLIQVHDSVGFYQTATRPAGMIVILLLSTFAFFLASFPARNTDIWMHMAAGRRLAQGEAPFNGGSALPPEHQNTSTWLYDV